METEAVEGLQKFSEESGLGLLVEQWGYWFIIGLALLFVRESISNIISGAMIFLVPVTPTMNAYISILINVDLQGSQIAAYCLRHFFYMRYKGQT